MNSYTVAELNNIIKKAINVEFKNKSVTVTGEVSNLKISGTHSYLTLKDDTNSISVVFWNSKLNNKHGDNVEIICKLNYYAKSGYINLIGSAIQIIGIGSLHAEYEKIKKDYEKKGYFNNKKDLPDSVKRVGIITSETGAALQDFLYVLKKNEFSGNVYIYDCIVQGDKCPGSVASGIKFFNSPFYLQKLNNNISQESKQNNKKTGTPALMPKNLCSSDEMSEDPFEILSYIDIDKSKTHNKYDDVNEAEARAEAGAEARTEAGADAGAGVEVEVDVIVVTRGGGSFEDLMGFSHPKVIEAIHRSKKYCISAVGHEVDSMLSDYVAQYRAPTPSLAGEAVCSVNINKKRDLQQYEKEVLGIRHTALQELFRFKNALKKLMDVTIDPAKKLNSILGTILHTSTTHINSKLSSYKLRLNQINQSLNNNNITKLLECGFIIMTDINGIIVKNVDNIFNKDVMLTHHTGRYKVKVTRIENNNTDMVKRKRTNSKKNIMSKISINKLPIR